MSEAGRDRGGGKAYVMNTTPCDAGFDPLIIKDFFDARARAELLAVLREAPCEPASVYGRKASGYVDERARKTTRLRASEETARAVRQALMGFKAEVESHFRLSLRDCEEAQFLRYSVGDFFVAHQDGNTGMLRLDSDEERRISVVILLSRQSETPEPGAYCGGSLIFSGRHVGRTPFPLRGEPGTLIAFRSETTHEVTPVTHGERHSIVCWYR